MNDINKFIRDFESAIKDHTKVFVVLNERHSILPEQMEIIRQECETRGTNYAGLVVPQKGFTKRDMDKFMEVFDNYYPLYDGGWDDDIIFVFVSPVPYLLSVMSFREGYRDSLSEKNCAVRVFHNDRKIQRDINGKKSFTSARNGWQLI